MAVTVVDTPTLSGLAVAASVTFSYTTGATADGLFVGAFNDSAVAFSTATFNGDSLTEKWDLGSTGVVRSCGYLMVAPDITTANIVVTAASSTTLQAGAVSLNGLDQTTPNRTPATAADGSGGPSVAATSESGDLVIDCATVNSTTITVGASQTSRVESDDPGGTSRSWGISTESATGTSTTMSWTGSDFNVIGAMALIAAAVGSGDADSDGAATLTATGAAETAVSVSADGIATAVANATSTHTTEVTSIGVTSAIASSVLTAEATFQSIGEASAVAEGSAGGFTAAGSSVGQSTAVGYGVPGLFIQAPDPGFDGTSPGVLAFGSDVTVGSLIVLGLRIGSTTTNVTSISDTQTNTYELDVTQNQITDGHQIRVYHVDTAKAGPTTVTVSLDSAASLRIVLAEYARMGNADRTASFQASPPDFFPSSGTAPNTREAEELLVGLVGTGAGSAPTITAGSQFFKRATASRVAIEDRTVAEIGSYAADWSLNAASEWSAAIVTYRLSQPVIYSAGTAAGSILAGASLVTADASSAGATVAIADAGTAQLYAGGSIQTFDLTWDAVVGATGYDVGYDTDTGEPYTNVIDVGNVTEYILGPLARNTWYMNVRAYDGTGPGAWDTELVGVINATYTAAGASQVSADFTVTGVATAEAASMSAIAASFEAPGVATAIATGESLTTAVLVGAAAATLTAAGSSQHTAVLISDGVATAIADGGSVASPEQGIASATGLATAQSVGAILAEAAGASVGTSDASAEGSLTLTADAFSRGLTVAIADSDAEGLIEVAEGVLRPRRRKKQQEEEDAELIALLRDVLIPYMLRDDSNEPP